MTRRWEWDDEGTAHIDPAVLGGLRETVGRVLERQGPHYVEWLRDLLRYRTISGSTDPDELAANLEAMDDCLRYVQGHAAGLGMAWREHEGIAAVAEWRGRNKGSVGVAAHLDVVPPEGAWTHPPFAGELVDGEVWGRGAQDDKGPVAAVLAALHILQEMGLRPEKDIRLLLGTLEETDDWPDMDLLLEREEPPDVTLVPDGAFPVIVGEKGILTVEWHGSWPRAETDVLRFLGLRGGDRHNVVPAEARLWFACPSEEAGRRAIEALPGVARVEPSLHPPAAAAGDTCLEAVFEGVPAHGAFPHDGRNAATAALRALHGLLGDHGPGLFARFLLEHCDLDGAGLDLDETHIRMGGTTVNLGVAETGTTHGHAYVNVRYPLGLTTDDVLDRFRRAAATAPEGLTIRTSTRGRPQDPILVDPDENLHLVRSLQAAYHTVTGRKPHLASIAGTTYAKIFPLAVAFGPQDDEAGDPILAHQRDERVSVKRYLENVHIYAVALALLAFDHDEVAEAVGRAAAHPQSQS